MIDLDKIEKTLDNALQAMSDEEWNNIALRIQSKKAFQKAEIFKAKRNTSISFADWILKHDIQPLLTHEMESQGGCWLVYIDSERKRLDSTGLFNLFMSGELDMEDDEGELEN